MINNHEIEYKIHGEEMQYVEVELDPQETAVAEAGAFLYRVFNYEIYLLIILGANLFVTDACNYNQTH